MPEYLSPGVYVEEVSFRSKTIEGVPTSTTGMAGLTRFGPVQFSGGPTATEPRLITSFTEFERTYGGLEPLKIPTRADERLSFLAHAARAFFENGGQRLYVSRVYDDGGAPNHGVAVLPVPVSDIVATWTARWPGEFGNVLLETRITRGGNVAVNDPVFGVQGRSAKAGAVVEVLPGGTAIPLSYTGTVPDPFREGREVVVTVEKQGGAYVGERNSLITKCPSKYKTAPASEKQNY